MKNLICLILVLCGSFVFSQNKKEETKELISLSGVFKLSKGVEKDVISRYKEKYNNVPDSVWKSLEPKLNINSLIDEVINIYESKFTEKEIDELLIFYKSELGKKLILNSPTLMTEIQNATSNWAMNITNLINSELEEKGYLQSPPPPQNYSSPPPPMKPKN